MLNTSTLPKDVIEAERDGYEDDFPIFAPISFPIREPYVKAPIKFHGD